MPDFYRPDELKYHGKRNRGHLSLNFFDVVHQTIGADAGSELGYCGGWVTAEIVGPIKGEPGSAAW